ncbi:MAG: hypothetical protein QOK10_2741 [Pseudonocardiales bacterium]|jgi:hypothetical protein|nr:hypothetical protein [Pseudonocardiales bacterium]
MASPVEVQLILADAAQANGGKVSMLGAGWSVTGTPTAPQAVVGLLKVPWDRANEKLPLNLQLVDADGQPVLLPGPDGVLDQQVQFTATVEVGRPPGLTIGTPIDSSFTVNVQPLPLAPGRYTWRLEIGGEIISTAFGVVA